MTLYKAKTTGSIAALPALLFIISLCVSCSKPAVTLETGQVSYTDIAYGTDAKQKVDIYLPANRNINSTKTFVMIHGGGWTSGDKTDMNVMIDSLKKRLPEYAFINLNYRLASNNSINVFPTQENDVKAAIEFYISQSLTYQVSKELVLLGTSAGGHLVLLHGYKNDPSNHVKAIVDCFGPTDIVAAWNAGLNLQLILYAAIGKTYPEKPDMYIQSSPLNFITPKSPPTIALQGGADPLVPPSQTNLLITKLTTNDVINELVYYPTEGHGWGGVNLTDSYNKIQAFVLANVH